MADCYAREMDDLHRRWLPREILADIGIADAAPHPAAAVQDLTVHLVDILGGEAAPRPPLRARPGPYHHHHHRVQVCGLEGRVVAAYGGNGGGAPPAWPFLPCSPVQWQVATNFGNGGGVPDPRIAPLRPCRGPPPATLHIGGGASGTGVFLPRAQVYQTKPPATKSPSKDGRPPFEQLEKQQRQWTGRRQQQLQSETTASETTMQQQSASAALLALPQEWTY